MLRKFIKDLDNTRREIRMLETEKSLSTDENEQVRIQKRIDDLQHKVDHRAKRNYGI
jgi:hypothetical protein